MKWSIAVCLVPILAAVLPAQGPPGRGREFGGGGFGGRGDGILGAGPGSRTPVTGAPYSAVETVQRQQPLANGNQISTKGQSTVYRDSQGRIRTEETITPPASSIACSKRCGGMRQGCLTLQSSRPRPNVA